MKACPQCQSTYTDDSLIYCLADGSLLDDLEDQPTVARTSVFEGEPTLTLPRPAAETLPQIQESRRGTSFALKAAIALSVLAVLGALAIAGMLIAYYSIGGSTGTYAGDPTPQPTTPRPTPDQNEVLKEKIAELERKLAEKEDQRAPLDPSDFQIDIPMSIDTRTATVDSPNDGFLALRSLPSSEIGTRLAKVPHGATVTIGICGPVVTPVKRRGRWCQASYGGYDGWLFDGYIKYGDSTKN